MRRSGVRWGGVRVFGPLSFGALVLSGALVGCDGCGDGPTKRGSREAERESPGVATVRGVVRLAEGAELPAYDEHEFNPSRQRRAAKEPVAWSDKCSPPKLGDRQPVKLEAARGLRNVLVAATGYTRKVTRPKRNHELVIEDCRLGPPVIAAQKGDVVTVRNTLQHPFLPQLPWESFTRALLKGQEREIDLDKAGLLPITCGFGSECGRTDALVLLQPLFSLTEAGGEFTLENIPAERVTINAWHPLFRDASAEVRLKAGESSEIELVLEPRPPRLEPTEESEEDKPDIDGPI